MRVVDVVQGFLGSGKTTLINNLIQEVFTQERILVIQTEWGEAELGDYGNRVAIRDWEKSFNLLEVRKLIHMPGVDRIIIELNGMAPASELLHALDIMDTRGEIKLGNCMSVFHGPTWEVMGKPLEEIFSLMVLTSQGFWIREGSKALQQWIQKTQPKGCLTTGNDWVLWYKQINQAGKYNIVKKLVKRCSVVPGLYRLYWLILKKLK
ncbi:GTP-binding protein [Desulfotomaculum sp. 1211_IL3151]|uniref:GTP-binding protein n=1 Tax=Desulfotomaculum sp. 1211_IL3151 TaxID=3084055 RepID=UPI002FD94DCC